MHQLDHDLAAYANLHSATELDLAALRGARRWDIDKVNTICVSASGGPLS